MEVDVSIRDPYRRAPDAYYAPPYGYGVPPPPSASSRDYPPPPPPPAYGAPVHDPYHAAPPSGYPYAAYNAPPAYGQPSYGQAPYGEPVYGTPGEKKKSKFGGMGTGLAVGAVAGALGGLALAEGADFLEDKVEDDVAERVEDDLGFDGDE